MARPIDWENVRWWRGMESHMGKLGERELLQIVELACRETMFRRPKSVESGANDIIDEYRRRRKAHEPEHEIDIAPGAVKII